MAGSVIPGDADAVVLLGSKSTISDLSELRRRGLDIDIHALRRRGGYVLGLCGGYQMLGRRISDPDGVEGPPMSVEGLGLLDVETVLSGEKRLVAVEGESVDGTPLRGYEMHMGVTEGPDRARPFARVASAGPEGAMSLDGKVAGTYLHGLFTHDLQRAAWLTRLGAEPSGSSYDAGVEQALDSLAAHLERHIDLDLLISHAA
jgi:adenosylcobyric acid synthase